MSVLHLGATPASPLVGYAIDRFPLRSVIGLGGPSVAASLARLAFVDISLDRRCDHRGLACHWNNHVRSARASDRPSLLGVQAALVGMFGTSMFGRLQGTVKPLFPVGCALPIWGAGAGHDRTKRYWLSWWCVAAWMGAAFLLILINCGLIGGRRSGAVL